MAAADWAVLVVYLAVVVSVGLAAGRRGGDTREYFLAGRGVPLWMVVASILATEISAATFVGGPDSGFSSGFVFLQTTIGAVLSRLLLGWLVIGAFYRAGVTTVYELLEGRFGPPARLGSAALFHVGRLFASGTRLYIAAWAFSQLTGLPLEFAILAAGGVAILYGVAGGLRADIGTDVIQAVVFLGSAVAIAGVLIARAGGPAPALAAAWDGGRLALISPDFRFWTAGFWANEYTLLGAVIGSCTLGLATHGTDQENVQRMLACRTERQSRLSVVLAGLLDLPVAALFLAIGVLLWVFYSSRGGAMPDSRSALFEFARTEMPPGTVGVLVAAIFAAAMSSLDSTLNSLAASSVNDFYRPLLRPGRDEAHYLRVSKVLSLVWGLALVLVAFATAAYVAWHEARSGKAGGGLIYSIALGVMGLFYGSLLGAFVVGLFTRRGSAGSTLAGMAAGVAVAAALRFGPLVSEGFPRVGFTWHIVAATLATVLVAAAVPGRKPLPGEALVEADR
ncbi:MAG: sodium/solute symporter [Planctomycetales bacterium]|nr:sodium/solute symporter [Planctomycetales bacterium]